LVEAINDDDLKVFWQINSSGRTRQNPFESPLWPIIRSSHKSGTKYFYLLYKGNAVACAALEQLPSAWNLWGLATEVSEQNKGYMGEVVLQLLSRFKDRFVVQVNHGGLTHNYFLKNCEATELATESWYRSV
jgi:hypothetical protein